MIQNKNFLLWRRYMAFVVDFVVPLAILTSIFDLIFIKIFNFDLDSIITTWGMLVAISLIIRDIFGRSLGKKIFGLKIISTKLFI